jgi:hypothetical protein
LCRTCSHLIIDLSIAVLIDRLDHLINLLVRHLARQMRQHEFQLLCRDAACGQFLQHEFEPRGGNSAPRGELWSLGGLFTPSFTPKDEHYLLFRKAEVRTESLHPYGITSSLGENFPPRKQIWPLGPTSPVDHISSLGTKLITGLCFFNMSSHLEALKAPRGDHFTLSSFPGLNTLCSKKYGRANRGSSCLGNNFAPRFNFYPRGQLYHHSRYIWAIFKNRPLATGFISVLVPKICILP